MRSFLLRDGWERVRTVLSWATVAVWRALMCLVMIPAALAVSYWMLSVAFGVTSSQGLVKDFYTYADTSLRAAPTGMIRVQTCDDVLPPAAPSLRDRYGNLPDCKHPRMVNAPAAEVLADQTESVESFYRVLVILSAVFMTLFYYGRHIQSIAERNDLLNRMIWLARH